MGVKQLWEYIKPLADGSCPDVAAVIAKYGHRAVVDLSMVEHSAFWSHGVSSEVLMDRKSSKFREACLQLLLPFASFKLAVCVDGQHPPCKDAEVHERTVKRARCMETVKTCLRNKSAPTATDLAGAMARFKDLEQQLVQELRSRNVTVIHSPFENDSQAAALVKDEVFDFVIARDGDLLWYDIPMLVPTYKFGQLQSFLVLRPAHMQDRLCADIKEKRKDKSKLSNFDRAFFTLGTRAVQLFIIFMPNDFRRSSLLPRVGSKTFNHFLVWLADRVDRGVLLLASLDDPSLVAKELFLFAPSNVTITNSINSYKLTQTDLTRQILFIQHAFQHAIVRRVSDGMLSIKCSPFSPPDTIVDQVDLKKIVGDWSHVNVEDSKQGISECKARYDSVYLDFPLLEERIEVSSSSTGSSASLASTSQLPIKERDHKSQTLLCGALGCSTSSHFSSTTERKAHRKTCEFWQKPYCTWWPSCKSRLANRKTLSAHINDKKLHLSPKPPSNHVHVSAPVRGTVYSNVELPSPTTTAPTQQVLDTESSLQFTSAPPSLVLPKLKLHKCTLPSLAPLHCVSAAMHKCDEPFTTLEALTEHALQEHGVPQLQEGDIPRTSESLSAMLNIRDQILSSTGQYFVFERKPPVSEDGKLGSVILRCCLHTTPHEKEGLELKDRAKKLNPPKRLGFFKQREAGSVSCNAHLRFRVSENKKHFHVTVFNVHNHHLVPDPRLIPLSQERKTHILSLYLARHSTREIVQMCNEDVGSAELRVNQTISDRRDKMVTAKDVRNVTRMFRFGKDTPEEIMRVLIDPYLNDATVNPDTGEAVPCPIEFFMPATQISTPQDSSSKSTKSQKTSKGKFKRRKKQEAERDSKENKKREFDPKKTDGERKVFLSDAYTHLPDQLQKLVHDKKQQLLVFMTNEHVKMLKDLSTLHKEALVLHMDTTFRIAGLNVTSLLVPGRFGKGVPIAWTFHRYELETEYELMLQIIKRKIDCTFPDFKPQISMTDFSYAEMNALCTTWPSIIKTLICQWHVVQAWHRNLCKVTGNQTNKKIIFQMLWRMLKEEDPIQFDKLWKGFLNLYDKPLSRKQLKDKESEMSKAAPRPQPALCTYLKTTFFKPGLPECWATCYRMFPHCNSDSNMLCESSFSKLKNHLFDRNIHVTLIAAVEKLKVMEAESWLDHERGNRATRQEHLAEVLRRLYQFSGDTSIKPEKKASESVESWVVPSSNNPVASSDTTSSVLDNSVSIDPSSVLGTTLTSTSILSSSSTTQTPTNRKKKKRVRRNKTVRVALANHSALRYDLETCTAYTVVRQHQQCPHNCDFYLAMRGNLLCRHTYACDCLSFLLDPVYALCKHIYRVHFLFPPSLTTAALTGHTYIAPQAEWKQSVASQKESLKRELAKKREAEKQANELLEREIESMTDEQVSHAHLSLRPLLLQATSSNDVLHQRTMNLSSQDTPLPAFVAALTGYVHGGSVKGGKVPFNSVVWNRNTKRKRTPHNNINTAPTPEEEEKINETLLASHLLSELSQPRNSLALNALLSSHQLGTSQTLFSQPLSSQSVSSQSMSSQSMSSSPPLSASPLLSSLQLANSEIDAGLSQGHKSTASSLSASSSSQLNLPLPQSAHVARLEENKQFWSTYRYDPGPVYEDLSLDSISAWPELEPRLVSLRKIGQQREIVEQVLTSPDLQLNEPLLTAALNRQAEIPEYEQTAIAVVEAQLGQEASNSWESSPPSVDLADRKSVKRAKNATSALAHRLSDIGPQFLSGNSFIPAEPSTSLTTPPGFSIITEQRKSGRNRRPTRGRHLDESH